MTATVMFNGSLYHGVVLRETASRVLVRFETIPGRVRETWFKKTARPVGNLVGRRATLRPGDVTIEANTAVVVEGAAL